jgi:type IV pilus assembly protein PilC
MIFTPRQLSRRAELYSQLGSMITAGVPLIRALEMTANNSGQASRKAISSILGHLNNGLTFSDSMQRVHGWMPEFDKALLTAGEHSGRLDQSFKLLGYHYATRASIMRETISRLMLPMTNLHVFLLIFPLAFLFNLVLGIMNTDYKQCVPFIVEKILAYGLLWTFILLLILGFQGKHNERWRSFVESFTQIFPVLGKALKFLVLGRLTAALEALVSSGVSVVHAWPLAAAASGSVRLKREVAKWESELQRGTTPSELVNASHYFPEMFKNVYHSGEISGKLEESLARLHGYFQEEGFHSMRTFSGVFSGTIYGMVALLIAYNVVKFWVRYYGAIFNAN